MSLGLKAPCSPERRARLGVFHVDFFSWWFSGKVITTTHMHTEGRLLCYFATPIQIVPFARVSSEWWFCCWTTGTVREHGMGGCKITMVQNLTDVFHKTNWAEVIWREEKPMRKHICRTNTSAFHIFIRRVKKNNFLCWSTYWKK